MSRSEDILSHKSGYIARPAGMTSTVTAIVSARDPRAKKLMSGVRPVVLFVQRCSAKAYKCRDILISCLIYSDVCAVTMRFSFPRYGDGDLPRLEEELMNFRPKRVSGGCALSIQRRQQQHGRSPSSQSLDLHRLRRSVRGLHQILPVSYLCTTSPTSPQTLSTAANARTELTMSQDFPKWRPHGGGFFGGIG